MRGSPIACLAAAALLFAWPLAFAVWFVSQEQTVYFWDYANYWLRLVDLSRHARAAPLSGLIGALSSISTEKYNDLPTLGLLPAALVAGTSRVAYVASIVVFFAWPTMALAAALLQRLCPREPAQSEVRRWLPALAALGTMALVPQFLLPVVLGSLDVVGCIVVLAILLLLGNGSRATGTRRAVLMGVLLGILPLLRRWYAFFTVSFYVVLLGEAVLSVMRGQSRGAGLGACVRRSFSPLAVMALATAVTVLPLAGPVGRAVFLRDHLFFQAPYRGAPGIAGALERLWTYFGSLTLGVAALGLVLAVRDASARRIAVLATVQGGLILYAFNRVQTLGENHFYLLLPVLVMLESYAITHIVRGASTSTRMFGRAAVALLLLAANFAAVLVPEAVSFGAGRSSPLLVALFGRVAHVPMQRSDLDEVVRLARATHEALPRPDASVYVLASSTVLNPDILRNAHLSLPEYGAVPDLRSVVRAGVHVDRRDGFPYELLAADVVVTAEPVQTHLDPAEQQVVIVPAREIDSRSTIGRSFHRLPESFQLEKGVTARVNVRARDLEAADYEAFSERLARSHPEAPGLLRPAPPGP